MAKHPVSVENYVGMYVKVRFSNNMPKRSTYNVNSIGPST